MMLRLREIRKQCKMTMKELGREIGVAESTISQYETGKRQPDFETLLKLSDFFGVSVDYILNNEPAKDTNVLTKKDTRDIARDLERIMADLESGGDLMFDGDPLSKEAKESIRSAMKLGLEAAKLKNKERFTPKKYQKD